MRIDHRFSEKDLLYGRYSYGSHHEAYQSGGPEMLNGISGVDQRWWPDWSLAINEVHTFSPTLTNELLISGTRDYQRRGSGDFQTNYAQTLLGLPNPFQGMNWPSSHRHRFDRLFLRRRILLPDHQRLRSSGQCDQDQGKTRISVRLPVPVRVRSQERSTHSPGTTISPLWRPLCMIPAPLRQARRLCL